MEATLKVMRSGNSDVVVLPAAWRRKHGVRVGDRLHAKETADGGILFTPENVRPTDDITQRLETLRCSNARYSKLSTIRIDEMKEAAHER